MKVHIRRGTINDAEQIRELAIKTFRDSFEKFNTPENMKIYLDESFSADKIGQELNDIETTYLLAFDDGQLVGYAKINKDKVPDELKGDVRSLEIERIYVDKGYIGKKIGKELLDECFQIARQDGTPLIWLGVWENNPRAIAFYRKHGFEKFGEHLFMLGDDPQTDWLMKKVIS